MENAKLTCISLDQAKRHVLFHHNQADGWITLAKKEKDGLWRQYHYDLEGIALRLSRWLGEDVYFSQNTFYKPQRRIENIRQLRALYVDVDCQVLNYDPEWVINKLDLEMFPELLPNPNIIIFSGRGLVCIWLLEPVPYRALPLWQAIQGYFCEQLKSVGADRHSIDATRVFRIAGSINSKNGKEVSVQLRHHHRYVLKDLQDDYLPELSQSQEKRHGRKPKIVHLHNIRNLHYSRLLDLVKLVDLRGHDVKGYREVLCFLYRYWSCCLTDDIENALQQTLEFNSEFKESLSDCEVIRATRSAEKAWMAKSNIKANEEAVAKGYPGAGYNLKNNTLIKWLDITKEEQKYLRTIIDGHEKRRRKREYDKQAFREKYNAISREQYLEQQKEITEDKLWQLQKAIRQYPQISNMELAELMNISESYIRKLKSKM